LETPAPVYDEGAVNASPAGIAQTHQESAMRIQPHSTAAALPAATSKSGRTPHTPAMKATAATAPAAARPAAARPAAAPAAAAPKVATQAKAAEAAAKPETYGGTGSLLDAHA
jgi:2-oxoglutarate dehydrogenase E1 component